MNDPESAANVPPLLPSEPPEQPVTSKPRRWWLHLLIIAAYPLLLGLAGAGQPTQNAPALSTGVAGLMIVCAVELIIFAVVFGLAWLASRISADELRCRWRGGFWTVPLGIGYSVAIRLAVGLVIGMIGAALVITHVTSSQGLQEFFSANRPNVAAVVDIDALRANPVYFWLTLTLVSFVLGGLREEIWRSAFLAGMRGLWPRRFGSRGGQIAAAGAAAVIFGVGHLVQGPVAMGLTALLGFGLGVIMILHRSIWPAVIAHGVFDATSLALLPWVADKLPQVIGQ